MILLVLLECLKFILWHLSKLPIWVGYWHSFLIEVLIEILFLGLRGLKHWFALGENGLSFVTEVLTVYASFTKAFVFFILGLVSRVGSFVKTGKNVTHRVLVCQISQGLHKPGIFNLIILLLITKEITILPWLLTWFFTRWGRKTLKACITFWFCYQVSQYTISRQCGLLLRISFHEVLSNKLTLINVLLYFKQIMSTHIVVTLWTYTSRFHYRIILNIVKEIACG